VVRFYVYAIQHLSANKGKRMNFTIRNPIIIRLIS